MADLNKGSDEEFDMLKAMVDLQNKVMNKPPKFKDNVPPKDDTEEIEHSLSSLNPGEHKTQDVEEDNDYGIDF